MLGYDCYDTMLWKLFFYLHVIPFISAFLIHSQSKSSTGTYHPSRNYFPETNIIRQQHGASTTSEILETTTAESSQLKRFVIVGGGWAGWGAAKALCESGVPSEIILIDSLLDATGATPYLSKTGKPVEAGHRGFWKDYPNIYNLCSQLGLNENDVFTPYTNSSFYSPEGLEATAPVFSESKFPSLPSPLGQVVATFPLFERIPLTDRVSMIGLLMACVDCLGSNDDTVKEKYDRMTAHELFIRFGVSKRLVDDFIRPTLLVGLFKPPEELSALVVMELLYYYALAHQDSFDVRWIRKGTVSTSLIAPLATRLQQSHNLKVMSGCRAGKIVLDEKRGKYNQRSFAATAVHYFDSNEQTEKTIQNVDGVILAVGCKGMNSIVKASPDLAQLPVFSKAASLKGIDVISVRLWFDRIIPTRTPANVFSRFDALRGAGGTFFMLDQLQGKEPEELWGNRVLDQKSAYGSVVACDFYNAGSLLSLSDDMIVSILTKELLPSAVPLFADAKVVDSWVGRFEGSVNWFSPGSFPLRPPIDGAGVEILPNIKCAGDWVRMGEREHGSKGLCQERAYVTGIEAANALLSSVTELQYNSHKVLPIRDDEPQFKLATTINQKVMNVLPRFWVR